MLELIQAAVSSERPVPGPVAQRAFHLAVAASDTGLLATLAKVAPLGSDLDTRLGEVHAAVVREAWLGRSGRDPAQVVERISKERRVGVLAVVADVEGLDHSVYEHLAEHPNPRVLLAVLENDTVSEPVRAVAAGNLAGRALEDRCSYQQGISLGIAGVATQQRLSAVVDALAVFFAAEDAWPPNDTHWIRSVCVHAELPEDLQLQLVRDVVGPQLGTRTVTRVEFALEAANQLASSQALCATALEELRGQLTGFDPRTVRCSPDAQRSIGKARQLALSTLDKSAAWLPLAKAAAAAADHDSLVRVWRDATGAGYAERLAVQVATHPHAGDDLALEAACTGFNAAHQAYLASLWSDTPTRLGRLLARLPRLLTQELLDSASDPVAVFATFARHVEPGKVPYEAGRMRVELLLELRPSDLEALAAGRPELAAAIVERFEAVLCDDEQSQLLAAMWDTYDGPTAALLDAVRLVATPARGGSGRV